MDGPTPHPGGACLRGGREPDSMSIATRYRPRHRASVDPEIVPGGAPDPAVSPTDPGEDPGVDPGPPGPAEDPDVPAEPERAQPELQPL